MLPPHERKSDIYRVVHLKEAYFFSRVDAFFDQKIYELNAV